jgi:hypothetical protein
VVNETEDDEPEVKEFSARIPEALVCESYYQSYRTRKPHKQGAVTKYIDYVPIRQDIHTETPKFSLEYYMITKKFGNYTTVRECHCYMSLEKYQEEVALLVERKRFCRLRIEGLEERIVYLSIIRNIQYGESI